MKKNKDLAIFELCELITCYMFETKQDEIKISEVNNLYNNVLKSANKIRKTHINYSPENILEVILKSVDMGEVSLSLKVPTNEYIESKNLPLGEYVLFSVSSNSLLLSENDLESMFDPYKIIDTTNRKNLLRAITLACVKNIVQQLQGVVWVESKILKNTSFNVIIPSNN